MKRLILFSYLICVSSFLFSQITSSFTAQSSGVSIKEQDGYTVLEYEGATGATQEVGKPQLPYVDKLFLVPLNATNITLERLGSTQTSYPGSYIVYPAQQAIKVSDDEVVNSFTEPDSLIYKSTSQYPSTSCEVVSEELVLGYRLLRLRFYPISYLPASRSLFLNEMNVRITYSIDLSKPSSENSSSRRATLARDYIYSIIENKSDLATNSSSQNLLKTQSATSISVQLGKADSIPDYIIITNKSLEKSFQRLADWRIKEGIPTIVKTIEEIYTTQEGADSQEKIRNYIKYACRRWGSSLSFLLGGDVNVIPIRTHYSDDDQDKQYYAADSYYANLTADTWNTNKNQIFAEPYSDKNGQITQAEADDDAAVERNVILGRIPVQTISEANLVVDKILSYEKSSGIETDSTYYKNCLLAAGMLGPQSYGGIDSLQVLYTDFLKDKFSCKLLVDAKQTVLPDITSELNKANFIDALQGNDQHYHFVYHMDHSGPQNMSTSSNVHRETIRNADVDNLSNGKFYQVVMSGGCHPANFEKDCIAEHFVKNANGGSVAFIGNTDIGWSNESSQFRSFMQGAYTGKSLGLSFLNIFSGVFSYSNPWRLHLFGDPEMPVWTDTPHRFNVVSSVNKQTSGEYLLTVALANSGGNANICISKDSDIYYVGTANNATNQYRFTPRSSGNLQIVITAQNYVPYEGAISITSDNRESITLDTLIVDDAVGGNNNGKIEAGESIALKMKLRNNSAVAVEHLVSTVACSSSAITLSTDSIVWGTISAGGYVEASFNVVVNKNVSQLLQSDPNAAVFSFRSKDVAGNNYYLPNRKIDILQTNFSVEVANPVATITRGDSLFLKFRITNTGLGKATNMQATLQGSYIANAIATCPVLSYGECGECTLATKVSNAYSSSYTTFKVTLQLINPYGRILNYEFDLKKRPTKVALSDLKYTCDTKFVQVYWPFVTTMKGYNVYRCDADSTGTEIGAYRKMNPFTLSYGFYSDNEVEKVSRYCYKVAAVSSSGVEGELSDALETSTSLPATGLFPIQTYNAELGDPKNSAPILLEDVNNDGYGEILTGLQYGDNSKGVAVALNYNGDDLFDIDHNITTHSGFARTNRSIWNAVAVADLFNKGKKNFVFAERGMGNPSTIYCYSFEDTDSNGKPDLIWKKTINGSSYFASIITANMDGSKDGSQEIVACGDANGNDHLIEVYSNTDSLLTSIPFGSSYAGIAVANLDGNSDLEIVTGKSGADKGVYIYHHDGTNFGTNPVFTSGNLHFNSTPVICDLDGDGEKEILIAGKKAYSGETSTETTIFAIKPNGTLLPGWGTQHASCEGAFSQPLSVGDLDHDGNLEVVTTSDKGALYVWRNDGSLWRTISNTEINDACAPLLADVDGDNDVEIITVLSNRKIAAFNLDGTNVPGFPIVLSEDVFGSPAVGDIDGDGKNEIVGSCTSMISVWKTKGEADNVEWGMKNHDARNTNEYVCPSLTIRQNTPWNVARCACGDIVVKSGGTLVLQSGCILTLNDKVTLRVENGGTLTLDGGTIKEANVDVLSGGSVNIINGQINLRSNGNLNLAKGALLNYKRGDISPK